MKCPFCGAENEDGALFCEQCKLDLSSVPATPAAAPEVVPMASVVEDPIPMATLESVEELPRASFEPASIPVAEVIPLDEPPPESAESTLHAEPPVLAAPAAASAMATPVMTSPDPAPSAPSAAPVGSAALAGAQPKLKVMRGLKVGAEFPIYADYNYIGRADEKPVDIDLEDQEPPDRVWCSRQHAVIHFDDASGVMTIEDLNSSNGTYVNRARVYPGQKKQLQPNDVVQIGTVHLKLTV